MMDTSEYMPMFLAEAREHLQELNLAVVKLEEAPGDRETVDEVFRIAHSLKGMSATMGFARIAELTHEMEDVFELLRQRSRGLEPEAVDAVLACLDALSGAVESIESGGDEQLDPAPLIERLRGLVRARTEEQEIVHSGGAHVPTVPGLAAARAAGLPVMHVQATLADDVMMPAVRAHMVLATLAEHGELIGSIPAPENVEQFQGRLIEAWLVSEHEADAVRASAAAVGDVTAATVSEAEFAADPIQHDKVVVATGPVQEVAPSDSKGPARTVRVDAERLDALMHLMGELVIHRTAVQEYTHGLKHPELQQAVQALSRTSQELQSMVMQVRMIPVEAVFLRFPRLVRDLGSKLGKDVDLKLVGKETELDRTVVDALGDPLVHLVRNALDHGLEPPEVRIAAGKPRVGTLEISARHAGGSVVIEVRDDGRGIDPRGVGRKALANGLIDQATADQLDLRGAIELLFAPGFSTAETTSDISGRGVGMDAVRAKIRMLGGEVVIDSVLGEGTVAQIRLPLTLAIVSALQVDVGGDPFAIPIDRIERTLRLSEHTVRSVAGRRMMVLDDGVLVLLEAQQVFNGAAASADHEYAVLVRGADRRFALAVDDLIGQRELVTRPLPTVLAGGGMVSGGAVLADGRITLIVDCDAVASLLGGASVLAPTSQPTQLAA
jgi:two-component system chemotaxis sensor kinase CheA